MSLDPITAGLDAIAEAAKLAAQVQASKNTPAVVAGAEAVQAQQAEAAAQTAITNGDIQAQREEDSL